MKRDDIVYYPQENQKNEHKETQFGKRNDKRIHISQTKTGEKGITCLGCGGTLIPNHCKEGRNDYFRHQANDVIRKKNCKFSNETERHKIAKEILQRIKFIKVPTLYKFPPDGVEGNPYKIRDPEFIKAHTVSIERFIYENNEGEICVSRKDNISEEEKHVLIKPDVTFLDKKRNPILLIELVVTHQIDYKKVVRLKRLGIDTVQVRIPNGSEEEIEKVFSITSNTNWYYNNEQEQTEYIQPAGLHPEGVPQIGEFERGIYEENFLCRKAAINDLIRAIERQMEGSGFKSEKERIDKEISRTERNTESAEKRLWRNIAESEEQARELVSPRRTELNTRRDRFRSRVGNLEERYISKREDLEREEKALDKQEINLSKEEREFIEQYELYESTREKSIEDLKAGIRTERAITKQFDSAYREELSSFSNNRQKMGEDNREKIKEIGRDFKAVGEETRTIESRRASLQIIYGNFKESQESDERRIAEDHSIENSGLHHKYKRIEFHLKNRYRKQGKELEQRFEAFNQRNQRITEVRDYERIEGLPNEISKLLEIRRYIRDLAPRERNNANRKRALKELREGTFFKKNTT